MSVVCETGVQPKGTPRNDSSSIEKGPEEVTYHGPGSTGFRIPLLPESTWSTTARRTQGLLPDAGGAGRGSPVRPWFDTLTTP
jgi:hypothetical protein